MRGPGYRTVLDLGYYSTLLFILTVILWSNGKTKAPTGFRWGKLKERDHLGDPGIDVRIILRWIFRKWDVGVWTGSSWLRIVTDGEHL